MTTTAATTTGLSEKDRKHPASKGLPLMTRPQLVAFLNESGIPISESTLSKLGAPSVGRGPPVAAWFGRRPLYEPAPSLEWARALLRDRPRDIAASD